MNELDEALLNLNIGVSAEKCTGTIMFTNSAGYEVFVSGNWV